MTRKRISLIAAAASASFVLAACGDGYDADSPDSPGGYGAVPAPDGGGSTIEIAADPQAELSFTEAEVTASPGASAVEFENSTGTPHNVAIEDADGEEIAGTETITGGSASTEADLEPGTYTFYCAVPGHRENGMEGTLTVD